MRSILFRNINLSVITSGFTRYKQLHTTLTLYPGCSRTFNVGATNTDGYQWQILNGISRGDLTDSGIHSGPDSAILKVTLVTPSDNGNQYRVIVSKSTFICAIETSNTSTM